MHSTVVLYIMLGNVDEMDFNITENPSIGLFRVHNTISQRDVWCLAYSTDKIRGKDADKIRVTQCKHRSFAADGNPSRALLKK